MSHVYSLMGLLSYDNKSESKYPSETKTRPSIFRTMLNKVHFLFKFILAGEFVCVLQIHLEQYPCKTRMGQGCLKFPQPDAAAYSDAYLSSALSASNSMGWAREDR